MFQKCATAGRKVLPKFPLTLFNFGSISTLEAMSYPWSICQKLRFGTPCPIRKIREFARKSMRNRPRPLSHYRIVSYIFQLKNLYSIFLLAIAHIRLLTKQSLPSKWSKTCTKIIPNLSTRSHASPSIYDYPAKSSRCTFKTIHSKSNWPQFSRIKKKSGTSK